MHVVHHTSKAFMVMHMDQPVPFCPFEPMQTTTQKLAPRLLQPFFRQDRGRKLFCESMHETIKENDRIDKFNTHNGSEITEYGEDAIERVGYRK